MYVNQRTVSGTTALIKALRNKQIEIARLLIEKGANVNMVDISAKTPLLMAVLINSVDAIDLMIKSGASLTYSNDPYFPSYMHYAVLRESKIVLSLLRHGAKFDTKNVRGETPLYSAVKVL